MDSGRERPFEFGDWRVDPSRGVLTRAGGAEVRIEPKLMDLLVLFAGSGGRVLSKDEIVAAAWDGRAIGDDTLAGALSRLRRALGETSERRYIETLPKRGYRALVESPSAGAAGAPAGADPPEVAALIEQGRRALASPLPMNLTQARACFDAAVAAAPCSARAYAGLADCLIAQHFAGQGEGLADAAKTAARAAVGLDEGLATAWAALGLSVLLADRDFAAADQALQRAIGLDPELYVAHRTRSFAFAAVGRFVEAEREMRRAVALQPYSLDARDGLLQVLLAARRFGHAVAEANEMLKLAPQSSEAWYARGWALVLSGRLDEGMESQLKGLALWGVDPGRIEALAAIYRDKGFQALASAAGDLFEGQQMLLPRRFTDLGMLRAQAGEADKAMDALEAAADRDDPLLMMAPWLPHMDPLRSEPRFQRLLARLRLVH
jgi:DNA-binding winged helix-turn-helix (wHTH) protein